MFVFSSFSVCVALWPQKVLARPVQIAGTAHLGSLATGIAQERAAQQTSTSATRSHPTALY